MRSPAGDALNVGKRGWCPWWAVTCWRRAAGAGHADAAAAAAWPAGAGEAARRGGVPFLPRHVLEDRERRTALLYFCMMKPCALLMGD